MRGISQHEFVVLYFFLFLGLDGRFCFDLDPLGLDIRFGLDLWFSLDFKFSLDSRLILDSRFCLDLRDKVAHRCVLSVADGLFGFSLDLDLLGLDIHLLGSGLAGGSLIAASLLVIARLIGSRLDARHGVVAVVLGTVLGLIPVTTTIASTTTATATTTTATTATSSSVLEAILLVVVAALLPVVIVTAAGVVTATSAASGLAGFPALVKLLRLGVVRLNLSLLNKLVLLVAVGTLAHDLEVMVVPLGGRLCLEELVGLLLIGECNKDGALEETLVCASKLDTLDLAKLGKEALKIKLSVGGLVTKALDVDGGGFDLGLGGVQRLVRGLALELLLTLLTGEIEELAVLEGSNDGAVGLECSHALEGVDGLDLHGLVLGSAA
ncbi:hypothetical protein HG531_009782 [Fusarium graminearum]|nr:hypothetical protein HG531_009782 [Fusarium graminearum]